MKKITGEAFSKNMRRLSSSWCYVKESFAETFEELKKNGGFSETGPGEKIWETRSKYVLKLALKGGSAAVYKGTRQISRPARFILRPSLSGFEAENFSFVSALGIPVAELLAAGDERSCFILKKTFLITRFAEGFLSGLEFLPEKQMENREELLDEFLRRNLLWLARCHDAGLLHRGSTPANFLWKKRSAPDGEGNRIDLLWIDLASCRRRPMFLVNKGCIKDLKLLFKPLGLPPEKQKELIAFYCAARKNSSPAAAGIIGAFQF